MSPTIFTIGYEGADPERFAAALDHAGVAVLADVRAVALSRKRGFSKNALRANLLAGGMAYEHFVALGTPKAGREAARAGDAAGLRAVYETQLATPEAQDAFADLETLARQRPICLMCFERDPALCHRRMLAERLEGLGFRTVDLTVP
ncbi:DUF488 domain-containing protein [Salinarimonas soli]|uniref:DUF488 domain-containing protein n=1 Tax=Salinarimonas soli TaxID=1638099 RepID=A0A5B2VII2_9HYPH|nr:DUF488 domain-containing protein [Salinarimonas soli]KAA2238162.1 DUF488 domain-containing protein [Salinarimonas soli]